MTGVQKIGVIFFLVGLVVFTVLPFVGTYTLTEDLVRSNTKEIHQDKMTEILAPLYGEKFSSNFSFLSAFGEHFDTYNDGLKSQQLWDQVIWDDYSFALAKAALESPVRDYPWYFLGLSIGLAVLGGLLYAFPLYSQEPEGIKNNGIFHSKLMNRGWMGIAAGTYLILFYILLYWFPAYLVNVVTMVDPISTLLNGGPASQWFLYGLIYTLAIIVFGIRMFRKYRGNKYQQLRTASLIFFQTGFAFLIPEILVLLNKPYFDFKNIWPLDYDFFYDYQIETFLSSGGIGMFMLVWGILLILIGVPVFTYFFGKRWYCSWVCGCGGLAETLGDPFRQLSDKSVKAWKYERVIVHSVLVLVVLMTVVTLANYFSGFSFLGNVTNQLHSFYGFAIGSAFAGVVGTGFYPLMGNRVWCRFGCPLAAYLGLVQRFKSRFRITTNGGQCISCGNCSTYCEMGIDVRWYAQRGQNIVRSSCVGCGVCSSVCPRGVLKLENGPEKNRINDLPIIIGNDSIKLNP
ncbi:4Fe-4S binding protein [Algoriphagus sp. CAU 1675]|uniref:4Fe-4S binding protein n=1 Tax=Algoriphagus sp. CAU 1675 TaxID=3032597 RepID=UPI0023DAAC1C|nr:4Fe-4S binding protein [Algoriphagus sp. CAU 1675]MDF2158439.1 4Fe-4S binding protein [Algoriphagus sp. CAU 1675]